MSEEKKHRGKPSKPGIPFKKQTPKQRAIIALIRALGTYGYREARYVANKFINENSIKHMNMPLLAKVLAFIEKFDIEDQLQNLSISEIDISSIKELNVENIRSMNNQIFESKQNVSSDIEYKNNVDFIRYFIFALTVLKSDEVNTDNTTEIDLLTVTIENR